MGLEDIVGAVGTVASKVKDHFLPPSQIDDMVEYSIRHYLPKEAKALIQGKTREAALYLQSLRAKIAEQVQYQQGNLDRLTTKIGKGTGLAALINDVYNMYRGTPFSNFGPLQAVLVGGKALLELPAMYEHLTKTGDLYGMVEWLGSKLLSWLVPIFGPGLDYNVATRIIRRNAIYRGTQQFLKELKLYKEKESLPEKLYSRVKGVAGERLAAPQYATIPAAA